MEVKRLEKDSVEKYLMLNRKLILLTRLINHQLQQKVLHSNISAGAVTGAVNGTIGMIQGYNSMQNAVKGTDELMAYSGQRTD